MVYDGVEVLGEHLTSEGSVSFWISVFWAGVAGKLSLSTGDIRIGVVKYFFLLDSSLSSQTCATKRKYRMSLQKCVGIEPIPANPGYHLH